MQFKGKVVWSPGLPIQRNTPIEDEFYLCLISYIHANCRVRSQVMNHQLRCETMRHCKWADEILEDAPWVISKEYMEKYKIDFVAHDALPCMGLIVSRMLLGYSVVLG
jgi:hypothetical protein